MTRDRRPVPIKVRVRRPMNEELDRLTGTGQRVAALAVNLIDRRLPRTEGDVRDVVGVAAPHPAGCGMGRAAGGRLGRIARSASGVARLSRIARSASGVARGSRLSGANQAGGGGQRGQAPADRAWAGGGE